MTPQTSAGSAKPSSAKPDIFRAQPPAQEAPYGRALRSILFVPGEDELPKQVTDAELEHAVKDTETWLRRILRPQFLASVLEARWVGFRKGTIRGREEDMIYARTEGPLGALEIQATSAQVVLRLRLVEPVSAMDQAAYLEHSLGTADRLMSLETPKPAEKWYLQTTEEFVMASRIGAWKTEGWKALDFLTDGQGVAFTVRKLAEGMDQFAVGKPLDQWLAPNPHWFADPPRTGEH